MKLTALLLVVLWLPATSHEWLESAGVIHSAAHGEHDPDHDAADGQGRLESGTVAPKVPVLTSQPWLCVIAVALSVIAPDQPIMKAVPCPCTAPPELRTTWQFTERVALPSRAPSYLA